MTDLSYSARFALGAIHTRKICADEALEKATRANIAGDIAAAQKYFAEADRHMANIVANARILAEQSHV